MTEEQKQTLIKDLCGRLPYKVKIQLVKEGIVGVLGNIYMYLERGDNGEIELKCATRFYGESNIPIEEFKPYLRPLSSITEEQKAFFDKRPIELDKYGDIPTKEDAYGDLYYADLCDYLEVIDWLNAHHFDYRGLIEQDLAIDATDMDIY